MQLTCCLPGPPKMRVGARSLPEASPGPVARVVVQLRPGLSDVISVMPGGDVGAEARRFCYRNRLGAELVPMVEYYLAKTVELVTGTGYPRGPAAGPSPGNSPRPEADMTDKQGPTPLGHESDPATKTLSSGPARRISLIASPTDDSRAAPFESVSRIPGAIEASLTASQGNHRTREMARAHEMGEMGGTSVKEQKAQVHRSRGEPRAVEREGFFRHRTGGSLPRSVPKDSAAVHSTRSEAPASKFSVRGGAPAESASADTVVGAPTGVSTGVSTTVSEKALSDTFERLFSDADRLRAKREKEREEFQAREAVGTIVMRPPSQKRVQNPAQERANRPRPRMVVQAPEKSYELSEITSLLGADAWKVLNSHSESGPTLGPGPAPLMGRQAGATSGAETPAARQPTRHPHHQKAPDVHERLYETGMALTQRRDLAHAKKMQEELEAEDPECSFRPAITAQAAACVRLREKVHLKTEDLLLAGALEGAGSRADRAQAQGKRTGDLDCTFRPDLSRTRGSEASVREAARQEVVYAGRTVTSRLQDDPRVLARAAAWNSSRAQIEMGVSALRRAEEVTRKFSGRRSRSRGLPETWSDALQAQDAEENALVFPNSQDLSSILESGALGTHGPYGQVLG